MISKFYCFKSCKFLIFLYMQLMFIMELHKIQYIKINLKNSSMKYFHPHGKFKYQRSNVLKEFYTVMLLCFFDLHFCFCIDDKKPCIFKDNIGCTSLFKDRTIHLIKKMFSTMLLLIIRNSKYDVILFISKFITHKGFLLT